MACAVRFGSFMARSPCFFSSPALVPCQGQLEELERELLETNGNAERLATKVYERSRLKAGNVIVGPAIVEQMDTTTVVAPGWTARVEGFGNIIITLNG